MAKYIMLCCLFIIIPWVTCNESCGKSKYLDAGDLYLPPAEAQIVGGLEARPNEFPWQVSLRFTDSPILEHFCSGAIINKGWILTAAHCLKQKYIKASSDFFVVVGGHNIRETINIKYHKVDKFIIHGEYTVYRTCNGGSISMFNDIALIKVTPPIQFNDDVSPVCLPDTEDLYVHRQSIVSGWGQLESDDCKCNGTEIISPEFLMYTTLNIPTTEFCQERLPLHLKESMMCASDNRGAKIRDSCQGDSGGPMTVKDNSSVFSVVGIVSLGVGCAYGYPGIYTRVSHFIDWINDTITRE